MGGGLTFAIFRMGAKGVRTPPKLDPKSHPTSPLPPTLRSGPTKIFHLTEILGGTVPYRSAKRTRRYLHPVLRYGSPNRVYFWGPQNVQKPDGDPILFYAWKLALACILSVQKSDGGMFFVFEIWGKNPNSGVRAADYGTEPLLWRPLAAAIRTRSAPFLEAL